MSVKHRFSAYPQSLLHLTIHELIHPLLLYLIIIIYSHIHLVKDGIMIPWTRYIPVPPPFPINLKKPSQSLLEI